MANNFDLKKYLKEGKLYEEEDRITRKEVMADIFKMVEDLEKKLGIEISRVNLGDHVGIDIFDDDIDLWGGSKQIWVGGKYPTPKEIEYAYSSAKEWVDNFPKQYADYLSWKEKGEEAFNQEVERRKEERKKRRRGELDENEMGSDNILPAKHIKRYARMKTVANVTDPEVLSKIMMAFQALSKNQNMSYEEMINQFGEEAALKTFQILRSAWIDGYADKFQNLQRRLSQETDEYYADGWKYRTLDENEMSSDIFSFLQSNKNELLQTLASKFDWDEDDMEEYSEMEIGMADEGIAGLGEGGLDFSFDRSKVKDEFGDASEFEIKIAGKPVYGIAYNF